MAIELDVQDQQMLYRRVPYHPDIVIFTHSNICLYMIVWVAKTIHISFLYVCLVTVEIESTIRDSCWTIFG